MKMTKQEMEAIEMEENTEELFISLSREAIYGAEINEDKFLNSTNFVPNDKFMSFAEAMVLEISSTTKKTIFNINLQDICDFLNNNEIEPLRNNRVVSPEQLIPIINNMLNGNEPAQHSELDTVAMLAYTMFTCVVYKRNLDTNIDPSILTDDEKRKCFNNSIMLVKFLFSKAVTNLYSMRIEDISTFEMLQELIDYVEDNGADLLPYLTNFKRHKEIGQSYNVELFQVYSFIVSTGYGVKILMDSYGDKWVVAVDGIKSTWMNIKKCKWIAMNESTEKLYQFSITYQPNKINQYAIKLLLDMGMSRRATTKLPIKQNTKVPKIDFDKITLPTPPLILEA